MARDEIAPLGRGVQLHAGPREAIGPAISLLGRWFDLDGVVIGGGTALEARWHHRRSTDIDLFAPRPYLSSLAKVSRERIEAELHNRASPSRRVETAVGATHLRCVVAGVPVSLSGTRGFWKEDHDPCVEASTGMPLASSADILLRKMQGRTLAQGRAVARDAYDFIVARAVDPISFRDAVAHLDEGEAEVIAETFEVLADAPPRTEGRGVEAPAYPAVLKQGLWKLAAQVFRHPRRDLDIGDVGNGGRGGRER